MLNLSITFNVKLCSKFLKSGADPSGYKYDIFNRRIGTENIALIYGDMAGLDKFFMKLYDTTQYFFIIVGFYILKSKVNFRYKLLFKNL